MTPQASRPLDRLLRQYGLTSHGWLPLVHSGFSGASLFAARDLLGGEWVLKQTSCDVDWIMQATDDAASREHQFARVAPGDTHFASPAVGAAFDGAVASILMRNVASALIGRRRISSSELEAVIMAITRLHRLAPPRGVDFCSVQKRVILLSPLTTGILRAAGAIPLADMIDHGWRRFFKLAPTAVAMLVREVVEKPVLLERALATKPQRLLHGDLKLDNIAVTGGGDVLFIDWAMVMESAAALELGWFLAVNSKEIACSLDHVVHLYRSVAPAPADMDEQAEALAALSGLTLRGWRKALDADGGGSELDWWCERAIAAASLL